MAVDRPNPEIRPVTAMNPGKNRGGIVVPHAVKWPQAFLALTIYVLLRLVGFTLRYRWNVPPNHLPATNRPYIFAIWHNRLALSLIMYGKAVRRAAAPFQLAAIVSASKDGGVLARVLEHFGAQPVRGSSSRRGPQALLELTSWAERGYDLAITPDGPRGPCYVVQPGAISLAQVTGCPIAPSNYHLGWKIRVRSWDRFQIPLPFSRVFLKFGEPIQVPPDKILQRADNPTGRGVACLRHHDGHPVVRCFVRASEG